jgi:hypothetical protein
MKSLYIIVSVVLALGTILSTSVLSNFAEAQAKDCFTITTDGRDQEICLPKYILIKPFWPPRPDPCLCPIEILVDPAILSKMGMNQSLIDIKEGKQFDTVTLKIPKQLAEMNQMNQTLLK